jgi:hypothetical protein
MAPFSEGGVYDIDAITGKRFQAREFTRKEARFIVNDHALCMCDHAYAITRYMHVSNEENELMLFKFRVPQLILFSIIADLEERGFSIEILILKARQLGMSTIVELLLALRVFFIHGCKALIASAEQEKSGLMGQMIYRAYDHIPPFLLPPATSEIRGDQGGKLAFASIDSMVSVQHGKKKTGLGRGGTWTAYHLSEMSIYDDPEEQVEASIWKAVHPSPKIFGVGETTASGDTGWFPDKYRAFVKLWPHCRMLPLFLPWCCGIDMYPKPTWLRQQPVPGGWTPDEDTRNHVASVEMYIASTEVIRKHLCVQRDGPRGHWWADGRMPREQVWFWEKEHLAAKESGTTSKHFQELCGTPEEAFQASFDTIFGKKCIAELDTRRTKEYDVYAIIGQSISEEFEPAEEEIDYAKPRIVLSHESPKGEKYRWELVPLKYGSGCTEVGCKEVEDIDPNCKLFVFRTPVEGEDYGFGIDCGEGIGQNFTAMSVWRRGKRYMPDEQSCAWRSNKVGHVEAFAFGMAIGVWYRALSNRWPMLAAEQVASVGDVCQKEMRKMGYPLGRQHRMRRLDKAKDVRNAPNVGWFSYGWSRPILI